MADYISQLNGEQMDAALMDVALHNSEAWAVGTRNGYDVEQGDATFHNNAKYYAQVAQSAIPGTYTAAVRWDIAQGLAGEAQEQARANISAGASNRNLLDNPWLTIRQRGDGPFTGAVYTADRWKGYGGTTATLTENGVTLTQASGNHINFHQYLTDELFNSILGKTVTASIMDTNGTVYSASTTLPSTMASGASTAIGRLNIGDGLNAYIGNRTSGRPNAPFFSIYGIPSAVQTVTIRAFKLELGSYSTLANDVPPNYAEELRKCMYYFQRIRQQNSYTLCVGFGEAMNSTTNIRITIPTAVPMRHQASAMSAVPTGTGTMQIVGNGQLLPVTAVSGLGVTGNAVVVNVTVSTAGAYNHIYGLRFTNNSTYIDLSADL